MIKRIKSSQSFLERTYPLYMSTIVDSITDGTPGDNPALSVEVRIHDGTNTVTLDWFLTSCHQETALEVLGAFTEIRKQIADVEQEILEWISSQKTPEQQKQEKPKKRVRKGKQELLDELEEVAEKPTSEPSFADEEATETTQSPED